MGRACEGCNCQKYFNCMQCGLCVYGSNGCDSKHCLSCEIDNCNFKFNPELLKEFLDLDLQQVKENLQIAINSESEESLKKLLVETLEMLEEKENEC